jgi:flavin reductase (DIM6/NTAB) family NADH-FMN oxidoreductase RutF
MSIENMQSGLHSTTHSFNRSFNEADFPGMEKQFRTNLINCLSGFKSVNLVGTVSEAGVTNLAIFSQVFHVGANPPLMGMLVRPDSVKRDTLSNLLATGFFTLNHILPSFYRQAHQTSARYEVSEFEACGFTPEFSASHPAPYVQEAVIKTGLRFRERLDIATNGTILIVGEVVEIICPADCVEADGFLNLEKAGSITCSGLDSYHTTQVLSRLPYAKA